MPSCTNKRVAVTKPEAVFMMCSLVDKVMMRHGGGGWGPLQGIWGQQDAWDRLRRFEFYF